MSGSTINEAEAIEHRQSYFVQANSVSRDLAENRRIPTVEEIARHTNIVFEAKRGFLQPAKLAMQKHVAAVFELSPALLRAFGYVLVVILLSAAFTQPFYLHIKNLFYLADGGSIFAALTSEFMSLAASDTQGYWVIPLSLLAATMLVRTLRALGSDKWRGHASLLSRINRHRVMMLGLLLPLFSYGSPLEALELRFHPKATIYVYEEAVDRKIYSSVLHNIAFLNETDSPINVHELRWDVVKDGNVLQSHFLSQPRLTQIAAQLNALQAQGVLALYDFHFQTSKYLPADTALSASTEMQPASAILVPTRVLLFQTLPDHIVVTVRGTDDANNPVQASAQLEVEIYKSENRYTLPLRGTWFLAAAPTLISHHRWAINEEFALDLMIIGESGFSRSSNGADVSDFYAYGAPVYAVADGEVVNTKTGVQENNDLIKLESESQDEYEARSAAEQTQMLMEDQSAPAGNYVIIAHDNGEFSHYAHLKTGSVQVKLGDIVKQGDIIAAVGQSGNSTEPHLHFQITDGPDMMYSRGLPVTFSDVTVEIFGYRDRLLQTGWFVTTDTTTID